MAHFRRLFQGQDKRGFSYGGLSLCPKQSVIILRFLCTYKAVCRVHDIQALCYISVQRNVSGKGRNSNTQRSSKKYVT
jgi:hypothetical protein